VTMKAGIRHGCALLKLTKHGGKLPLFRGGLHEAASNWLRASNYFRTAETFLKHDDPRRGRVLVISGNIIVSILNMASPRARSHDSLRR
jgi:hypothetical protein